MTERIFEDRTAVVTGAARGIGAVTARALAGEGARVVLVARSAMELGGVADEIRSEGGDAVALAADLTGADWLSDLDGVAPEVDLLVNNAAILRTGRIENGEWLSNWESETQIGLRSWVLMTQILLPAMKKEGGAIVNLSSEGGFLGRPGQWVYDAIKAAVVSTTKTMAYEFVGYGIRVNAVAPGWPD